MPDVADLKVSISLDGADKVASGLKQADSSVSSFASNAERLGGAVTSVAAQFAAFGVVAGGAVAAGLGAAVSKAADFESGMSRVKAASSASASEMAQLGAAAIALGSDTQLAGIGATDAAKAMEELAKGGVSVTQQLGGATKGALLLASSGSIDVATAAGIATKAMNIFNLSGADVAHVADLMSAGANKSATDVGKLSQAFNQTASVAKDSGLSIEELTGTLALLAQNGLEGSDAGTSLKTTLQRLTAPTDEARAVMDKLGISIFDASGAIKPFPDIVDSLKNAFTGLTDEQRASALQTIGGADAVRTLIPLMKGGGAAVREWTAAVDDAGNAARTGATINDNLKGSMSQLGAVLETGAIQFGSKLLPAIRTATDETAKFIQGVMDSPKAQQAFDNFAASASKAITDFFTKVKDPAFQDSAKQWATAALEAGKAVVSLGQSVANTLGPPLREAVSWFNGLDQAGKNQVVSFGLVAASAVKFRDELGTVKTVVYDVIKAFAAKEAAKKTLTAANNTLAGSAGKTATAFGKVVTAAAPAAIVIADVAAAVALPVVAAAAMTQGFALLANRMDQTGQRAKDFTGTQQAVAIAQANGATATNNLLDGYMRYLATSGLVDASVTVQTDAWNRYVSGLQGAMFNLDGVTKAGTGTTAVMPAFSAALQAAGYELGNAGNKGSQFNNTLSGIGVGASAVASVMPTLTTSLSGGALALGDMATRSQSLGAGLGSAAISLGAVSQVVAASTAPAATFNAQLAAFDATIRNYSQAAAIATGDTGEFGTAMGIASSNITGYGQALQGNNTHMQATSAEAQGLQGFLGVLQGRWNELNVATENGKHVTAEQAAEYAKLAPSIDYLNGRMGVLNDTQVDSAIKATGNYQGLLNSAEGYGKTANAANAASNAFITSANATEVAKIAAIGASNKYDELGQLMVAIPPVVSATVTTNAPEAVTDFQGIQTAITAIPPATPAQVITNSAEATAGFVGLVGTMGEVPTDTPANVTTNAPAATGNFFSLAGAVNDVPKSVTVNSNAESAVAAAGRMAGLSLAVIAVPKSINITANVNIAGALQSIATLRANMPSSPAKEGPFRASNYPDFGATLDSFAPAIDGAIGQIGRLRDGFGGAGAGAASLLSGLLDGLDQATADARKKVADAVSSIAKAAQDSLSAMTAIASFDFAKNSPSGDQLGGLSGMIAAMVGAIEAAGRNFSEEGLKAAGVFADAGSKIMGLVKAGVDALAGLVNFVAPSQANVAAFKFATESLVLSLGDSAALMAGDFVARAATWAEAAGKSLGILKTGADGLTALLGFKAPSEANISDFKFATEFLMRSLGESAAVMQTDFARAAAVWSEGAGKALAILKPGVEGLTLLTTFERPTNEAIGAFKFATEHLVRSLGDSAQLMGTEAMARAVDWATSAGKIFGALQSGMTVMENLAKFKGVTAVAFDALLGGMQDAIDKAQGLVQYAKNLKTEAEEYVANMEAAAALFAKGMAAVGATPSSSPTQIGRNLGEGIASGARDTLDSHSPSQVMAAIGADVVAGLVQGMDANAQDAAKKAADVASAVAGAIQATLAALGAVAGFDAAKGPSGGQIAGVLAYTKQLVAGMAEAAKTISEDGLKATDAYAKGASAVVDTFGKAADLLAKLGAYVAPSATALYDVGKALQAAINDFAVIAEAVGADMLDLAVGFSDGAGKVAEAVGKGADGLSKLATYVQAPASAIYDLGKTLRLAIQDFAALADLIAVEAVASAAVFAEGAGKVADTVGKAATSLTALNDYLDPPRAAIYALGKTVMALVADFGVMAEKVGGQATKDAAAFADGAGKVVAIIGNAVDGLTKLGAYQGIADTLIGPFVETVRTLVAAIGQAAAQFTTEGLTLSGQFADAASKSVGILSNGVDGFTKLATSKGVGDAAIGAFVATVTTLVRGIGAASIQFTSDGLKRSGDFADAAAKAVGILGAGVTGFASLATFVGPTQATIDAFLATVRYTVARFGEMASILDADGTKATSAFADAAGKALGAVGAGVTAFKDMATLVLPVPAAIDDLVNTIRYAVGQVAAAAGLFGGDTLVAATAFGTAASGVFGALKSGLDLFTALDKLDVPLTTNWLDPLVQLMGGVLTRSATLVTQAQQLKADADLFSATLGQAFAGFTNAGGGFGGGLVLGSPVPVAVPNGGGGGGRGGDIYITITGNTILSDDPATADALARLLKPRLAQVGGY